jgi:hypothetical protein
VPAAALLPLADPCRPVRLIYIDNDNIFFQGRKVLEGVGAQAAWLAAAQAAAASRGGSAAEQRGLLEKEMKYALRLRIGSLLEVLDAQAQQPLLPSADNRRFIVGANMPGSWNSRGEVVRLPRLRRQDNPAVPMVYAPDDIRNRQEEAQRILWHRASEDLERCGAHQATFVFATGSAGSPDQDVPSFATQAASRGHRVEIWSWQHALSSEYGRLAERFPDGRVTVHTLDQHRARILFCAERSSDDPSDASSASSGGSSA